MLCMLDYMAVTAIAVGNTLQIDEPLGILALFIYLTLNEMVN